MNLFGALTDSSSANGKIPIMSRDTMRNGCGIGILGMHRSGTSALTGTLRYLGVELGDKMRDPHPGVNDKGYWEHLGIVRAHERLLSELRSSWDDVRPLPSRWWEEPAAHRFRVEAVRILKQDFASSPVWAVKDPRMCRLVPIWTSVFEDLGCRFAFVIIFRHPEEVARSLEKRDGLHHEKSARLWLEHILAAERSTRDLPRAFLRFDDLLSNGPAALARIQDALGFRFPVAIKDAREEIHTFLEPKLRHHSVDVERSFATLGHNAEFLKSMYSTLSRSCSGETVETIRSFDELHQQYESIVAGTEPAMLSHIADLQERIRLLDKALDQVESSTVWQVTRPLRKMERMVSRVFLG